MIAAIIKNRMRRCQRSRRRALQATAIDAQAALETERKRKNSSPSSERPLSAARDGNEEPRSLGRPRRAYAVAVWDFGDGAQSEGILGEKVGACLSGQSLKIAGGVRKILITIPHMTMVGSVSFHSSLAFDGVATRQWFPGF